MRSHERSGFTLVEIMIVVAIIALLAAIAIPNVLRGRTSANEAAAIGNMRALQSGLEMYRSVNNQFPAGWAAGMYGACPGGAGAPTPDFGPPNFCVPMAGGVASTIQGYAYTYANLPAGCLGTAASPCNQFTLVATPATLGTTGSRGFFTDDTGVVRHCMGVAPTVASLPIDQPPNAVCP